MIQHPKDAARPDSAVPGANGSAPSPRPMQAAPAQGVRAASPPCLIQRQVTWSHHQHLRSPSKGYFKFLSTRAVGVPQIDLNVTRVRAPPPPVQHGFHIFVSMQSTDLVSMVYSCIGAEIEDSDGSGTSDAGATADAEMSTAVSEAPAETCSNGHAAPSKQPMDTCRQERIVPLVDTRAEPEDGTKPSLAMTRQRHLQESLGNAGRSLWSTLQCVIDPKK